MGGLERIAPLCIVLCIAFGPTPGDAEEFPEKLKVVFRSGSSVFVSGTRDKPEGFDVDLVERFVAWNKSREGHVVTYMRAVVADMTALLRVAESGDCDLAAGSVTATAERDKRVDFSEPYLPVRLVLISPAGRFSESDYQDVLSGKKVGAISGSTGAATVKRLESEISNLTGKTGFSGNDELFAALFKEPPDIDAAVTDITHYWDLKRKKDVVRMAFMGPEQGLAFVFPEGSPLKARVDDFLEEFLHSQSYFTLVRHYFGQEASEMIRAARTQQSNP
jgi:polar amino acid transport system substrate-binding protein